MYDIQDLMEEKEHVLWKDRPYSGIIFRKADRVFVPFSVCFTFFVYVWLYSAWRDGVIWLALLGLPLAIFGTHLMVGRFIFDVRRRANTLYLLTNQRIIILSGQYRENIRFFLLDKLGEMELEVDRSGRGLITLGGLNPYNNADVGMYYLFGTHSLAQLEWIPNGREVIDRIRQAQLHPAVVYEPKF